MFSKIVDRLGAFVDSFFHSVVRLDLSRQQWIFVGVGILLMGLICMRGFGSRAKY